MKTAAARPYRPRASQLALAALAASGLVLAPYSDAGVVAFWIGALLGFFRFVDRRVQ